LDPIDGTQSFIRGVPLFGVLIGMEEAGEAVLGVVFLPALGEMVHAARGLGCWWLPAGHKPGAAPKRARVSDTARLAECTAVTTSPEYFVRAGKPEVYDRLLRAVRHERGWGDCYAHVLVATGRADVAVEPLMHVWDNAALLPVVVEAGGAFTDWKGRPTIAGGDAVSSNGKVHDEALRLVR
jgi:fructose-1,6-bisphosphatase/inositol monophosphatase family enzyme